MVTEGQQAGRMRMVWKQQNKKRTLPLKSSPFQSADDSDDEDNVGDGRADAATTSAAPAVVAAEEPPEGLLRPGFLNGGESRQEAENSLQSERFLNEGNSLAEEGRFGEALGKWEAATRLTPGNAVLHEQKAQLLLEIGKPWNALQAAACATELQPTWAEAWVTLARSQLNYGEPSFAVKSAQTALRLQPGHKEANAELERAQYLASRHRQAVRASTDDAEGQAESAGGRNLPSFRRARVYDSHDTTFGVEHPRSLSEEPKPERKEDDKLDKYDDDSYDWVDDLQRPAPEITTENLMSDFSDIL